MADVAAYAADKATEEMHRVDKKIADLSAIQTATLADNEDGGINLGVNVDDASIKISNVDGHVGQLTVGTIDCGTY